MISQFIDAVFSAGVAIEISMHVIGIFLKIQVQVRSFLEVSGGMFRQRIIFWCLEILKNGRIFKF